MKTWIKIVLIIVAIGLLGIAYIYFFMYNKPHLNVEKATAEYTLKAEDLYKEFKANKDAAGKKYNGKVIEINGPVKKIEKSDTLTVAVFIFEQGLFGDQGVRCTFLPDQIAKAKNVEPGNELKIKGFCTGFNDTDVILEKSSIVE